MKPEIARVTAWSMRRRTNEQPSTNVDVVTDHHRCVVYVSPAGRSVRCFLDGVELVKP